MHLVDTGVVSELRKRDRAHPGVRRFVDGAALAGAPLYLSAITVGELRRGVELIRQRGDARQALSLERWIDALLADHGERVLSLDAGIAHAWGRLRVPHPENPLDQQMAATALLYDLVLVTRNTRRFAATGVRLLDPFG